MPAQSESSIWFARPRAWQVLDGLIGVTMFVLSALLLRHALIGM